MSCSGRLKLEPALSIDTVLQGSDAKRLSRIVQGALMVQWTRCLVAMLEGLRQTNRTNRA